MIGFLSRNLGFAVLLTCMGLTTAAYGAPDTETTPKATQSDVEIVVMEAPGCIYCSLFRRDVLPTYEASSRGREVPVRFLDVNDLEKTKLELTSPVDIVPTFVVVKSGHELGRVPGYVGPENFFHAVNHILNRVPALAD